MRFVGQRVAALPARALRVACPQRRRALDEHDVERVEASRRGVDDRADQGPVARATVDEGERVGPAQLDPPRVERAGDHRAEEWADLGAREEVTSAARAAAAGEEAERRVVQRGVDVLAEAKGAALTNARTTRLSRRFAVIHRPRPTSRR